MSSRTISSDEQRKRMLTTPIPRLTLELSVPTVASQLVSVIYNTADTWFVSQISTSASAAVGVAFSLMSIIQAFGFGIGLGAGSLVSLRMGEKKDKEAEVYASSGFFAAILLGAVIAVSGLCFLKPLMCILGSTDTMLPYSCAYARYILAAAPVMCGAFVLSCILRSEGESSLAMWGICSGGLLNAALDPLLIFTLKMGISGAALATAISQAVSFIILLSAFLSGRSILKLSVKNVSRKARVYGRIILTGVPTICRQGIASVASAALNVQAAFYGDAAVAGVTIANRVYWLVRNIIIGIGQGFQPIAGFNFGAGNKKRTREAFVFACIAGTAVCVVSAALTALFPDEIMGWFRDDAQVIEIGRTALLLACAVMPLMAYSTFVNQLYQSLGFKLAASVLASCRQGIFFLPLIFIAPRFVGLFGVQMSQPGADLLTFFVSIPFQISFFRKHLSDNNA